MFWNKTITLYNKFENEKTGLITWHRHKIEQCFFKGTCSRANVGNLQKFPSESIVRIPEQNNYLPPFEWLKLADGKRNEHITLQCDDIIVPADVSDEIDEYSQGTRSSDLLAKYKALGVLSIKSLNVNTVAPGAHYLIRGE